MNKLNSFICILAVLFGLGCNAEGQRFSVKNNDTIMAIVSQRELTRFMIENDEIVSVDFLGGEIEYTPPTKEKGLIFKVLVPKPINGFIETKSGNVYKVIFLLKIYQLLKCLL